MNMDTKTIVEIIKGISNQVQLGDNIELDYFNYEDRDLKVVKYFEQRFNLSLESSGVEEVIRKLQKVSLRVSSEYSDVFVYFDGEKTYIF